MLTELVHAEEEACILMSTECTISVIGLVVTDAAFALHPPCTRLLSSGLGARWLMARAAMISTLVLLYPPHFRSQFPFVALLHQVRKLVKQVKVEEATSLNVTNSRFHPCAIRSMEPFGVNVMSQKGSVAGVTKDVSYLLL